MNRPLLLVLLVGLLSFGAEAAGGPLAPQGVALTGLGDAAALTWLPVPALPGDEVHYNVYDLAQGVLLASTGVDQPFLFVPPGEDALGVSAVVNGQESGVSEICITIEDDKLPPVVGVNLTCTPAKVSKNKLPATVLVPSWLP